MTTPKQYHREAMALLHQANESRENDEIYKSRLRSALEKELQALEILFPRLDAEPTRSILYKSAASMAIDCEDYDLARKLLHNALGGNPTLELRTELDMLFFLTTEREKFLQGNYHYTEELYSNAINVRFYPKENHNKYGRAIPTSALIDNLKNIDHSLINTSEVSFRRRFQASGFNNFEDVVTNIRKDSKSLLVNLHWSSFCATISSDNFIMAAHMSDDINNWKKSLLTTFKEDVIEVDYRSDNEVKRILEKYDEDERRKIYAPFLEIIKPNNPLSFQLTDTSFQQVYKTFSTAQPVLTRKILPPRKPNEMASTPEMVRKIFTRDSETQKIKEQIEFDILEYYEAKKIFTTFESDNKILYLNEPFELTVIFDNGVFIIDNPLPGVYLESRSQSEILKIFSAYIINQYVSLFEEREFNADEVLLRDALLPLISMRDF